METIMDVNYFIKKFEAIPENMIISFTVNDYLGNHCAIGWLGSGNSKTNIEVKQLAELLLTGTRFVKPEDYDISWIIADINNGDHPDYQQPTPKQRILAALYDIKAKQQPEPKEKVVYVTVDEKVRELQREVNTHQS
jgi:hypothetical protein